MSFFDCRFCGQEVKNPIIPLPEIPYHIREQLLTHGAELDDHRLSGYACPQCAIWNNFFCIYHKQVHTGVGHIGGHTCLECLWVHADALEEKGNELLSQLSKLFPGEAWEEFNEHLEDMKRGNKRSIAVNFIREILFAATANMCMPEEIVERVIRDRSPNPILHPPLVPSSNTPPQLPA